MPSVEPHVTVISASGSTSSPRCHFVFSAMASRKSFAPHVIAYWLTSSAMASRRGALHVLGRGEIREALREVDRAVLHGLARHLAYDRLREALGLLRDAAAALLPLSKTSFLPLRVTWIPDRRRCSHKVRARGKRAPSSLKSGVEPQSLLTPAALTRPSVWCRSFRHSLDEEAPARFPASRVVNLSGGLVRMSSVSEASNNQIDPDKLHAFMGKVVGDFGAALSSTLVYIGQRLGLYKALAEAGPSTPAELAERTGTVERYVREWLINQAAGGYVAYDPATRALPPPARAGRRACGRGEPLLRRRRLLRHQGDVARRAANHEGFQGGRRAALGRQRPGLVRRRRALLPPRLHARPDDFLDSRAHGRGGEAEGGRLVADIGCGHGASTIIMAKAYPNSRFRGFDNHELSIEAARQRAEEAGVGDRCEFEVSSADAITGRGLRPGLLLRLPARHGRPRGRGSSRERSSCRSRAARSSSSRWRATRLRGTSTP